MRKKRVPEHVSHDRWLVFPMRISSRCSLAFFVVLYASSQVDKRTAGRLAQAIQGCLSGTRGLSDPSNTKDTAGGR